MDGREFTSSIYKYGFNGKERDDDIKGAADSYDFGARIYDSRLGKWLSIDPMWEAYPMLSAYTYVANNPISSVDSKGELIIFVNGFARGWGRIVPLLVGAPKPKKYWGSVFVENAKDYYKDQNISFANGSGLTGGSIADLRRRRGRNFAKKELEKALNGEPSIFSGENGQPIVKKLEDGTLKWDETIKIVSHSHGGAFGAGIIEYVQSKGATVEEVVNIAPHGHFEAPKEPNTIQVNVKGDPASRYSGGGGAEQGTDLNITRASGDFSGTDDGVSGRHAAPLWGYKVGTNKDGKDVFIDVTFSIIQAAKQAKATPPKEVGEKPK